MSPAYRVEPAGKQFTVIDSNGSVVDILPTKEAAEAEIDRCLEEDVAWELAKCLFDTAIKTHMQMHGTSREVSLRLLRDAAEVTLTPPSRVNALWVLR